MNPLIVLIILQSVLLLVIQAVNIYMWRNQQKINKALKELDKLNWEMIEKIVKEMGVK